MEKNIKSFEEITALLDKLHVSDIQNSEHSSYLFKTETYALLIIRFFELDDDGLQGISTPYLIIDSAIYMYNRAKHHFIQMDTHTSLITSIEKRLRQSEWLVKRYIEETDKLEDGLYTRKIPSIFLDVWFDLKKDLTRVERILDRADEVLQEYMLYYEKEENFPKESLINILEHIGRYERLASLNATKLDTLYSYYNSLKNDKINNNIYALTILSGVFLPLNLVVGFFGMNTENLFFSGNPEGTLNVVNILIFMFISLLVLFPLARALEHFVLQKILGKFSLYNKLITKIKKITTIQD